MIPYRITVHCSDTPNGVPVSLEAIRKFHTSPPPEGRGWDDCGYHLVIGVGGQVEFGRPMVSQGAGVAGDNEGNVQICLIGKDRFTKEQFFALRCTLDSLVMAHNIKPWHLYTHNSFPSAWAQRKTCPGFGAGKLCVWYWMNREDAMEDLILVPTAGSEPATSDQGSVL